MREIVSGISVYDAVRSLANVYCC